MKVNKESLIGDILDYDQGTAEFFIEIGMHCLGCPASRGESICGSGAFSGEPEPFLNNFKRRKINQYLILRFAVLILRSLYCV